ncbi:hypothetical protein KOR34_27860 [Posidoniimonas corsicana]|uniref:GxxExxY protein n=2 Tax=Posidoniimonas corsicana TaxID=1938618 RepID=A0A5C5VJD7_9BACT|nr:hypothetical protein KOR34_27860 [Posidoniimonas corsicana]
MTSLVPIPAETELVAKQVVDAVFRVHSTLGPGLLESVYETCLCHELSKRSVSFRQQAILPIEYDSVTIDSGLRLDLEVEECLIVELKAVEVIAPIHSAQLLTYLKLAGKRLGLLVNFNSVLIKDGIKRVAL